MKITIEHEGIKCEIEDKDVVDIHQTMYLINQALLGVGFHPESIYRGFSGKCEEVENESS